MREPDALYLDLLKRCLLGSVYGSSDVLVPLRRRPSRVGRALVAAFRRTGIEPSRRLSLPRELFDEGRGEPEVLLVHGETMVGRKRLDNVEACVEDVLARGVEGDLIEAGVWRGGVTILMRALLEVRGMTDRRVWVADSFEGLPPASSSYPVDAAVSRAGAFAASLDEVRSNFARYGLLDDQVEFVVGWFKDTLPALRGRRFAVVRIDADRYESTLDALESLYPGLSVGGYLIVDDYGAFDACRQAVHDYRDAHGITEQIRQIDWTGIFWQREG
jgi:O-methyltransferase